MHEKLELSHTHFRQMRKHLANVEKAWGEVALVSVKEELRELALLAGEIEEVIKNRLYYNLKSEGDSNGTTENNQGRRATEN